MKIFVFTPDYTHQSAGIEMLHYFMYLLQRNGHEVHSNAVRFNPEYDITPIITEYATSEYDMIVAPEVSYLEELKELHVPIFRWVLYYTGVLGGDKKYGPLEQCYHWDQSYEKSAIESSYWKESKLFILPFMKSSEFNFVPCQRSGDIFWVSKGINKNMHPPEAEEITRENAPNRQKFLKLLRTHNTLYSYDRNSRICPEAVFSGMKVKIFNYENNTWENYTEVLQKDKVFMDYDKDGLAVGKILDDFAYKWLKHSWVYYNSFLKGNTKAKDRERLFEVYMFKKILYYLKHIFQVLFKDGWLVVLVKLEKFNAKMNASIKRIKNKISNVK